jgi:hypothetical protein
MGVPYGSEIFRKYMQEKLEKKLKYTLRKGQVQMKTQKFEYWLSQLWKLFYFWNTLRTILVITI